MAMPQPIMPWLQQQQGMNQYNPMFSGMGLGGSMMGNRGYGQQRSGNGGSSDESSHFPGFHPQRFPTPGSVRPFPGWDPLDPTQPSPFGPSDLEDQLMNPGFTPLLQLEGGGGGNLLSPQHHPGHTPEHPSRIPELEDLPYPFMPGEWGPQGLGRRWVEPMSPGGGYGQQRSGQGGTALGLRDLPPLNIPTLPTRDNPLGLPEMPPSDLTNPEWPIPSGPVLPKQEKDPPIDLGPLTPDYLKNPPQYERPWFVPKPWGKPYEGMPGQWGGGQWGPYTF